MFRIRAPFPSSRWTPVPLRLLRLACLAIGFCGIPLGRPFAGEVPARVTACDDVAEFPPFTYDRRDAGHKTGDVVGFAADWFRRILNASGRTGKVDLLPWQRCVDMVRRGAIAVALNAARTPERDRDFVFAPPYASLTPKLYFLSARAPEGTLSEAALLALRMCGQFGYVYPGYGVPDALVYHGAKTIDAAPVLLRTGHCDVFLGDAEVIAGQRLVLGHDIFPAPEFTSRPPPAPTGEAEDLDMMIGRALPYQAALLGLLEQGEREQEADGGWRELADRYLGPAAQPPGGR